MSINMKKAREAAGLSQKQVALTMKVSPPTVSDWESGKIKPTADKLKKLSDLYKVSVDYLLGLTYPLATFISKAINIGGYFLGTLALIFFLFSFSDFDLLVTLLLGIILAAIVFLQVSEPKIIAFVIARSTPVPPPHIVSEEELKTARAHQRKAAYFLSLGSFNREFRNEAQSAGMTPAQYKQYCKKVIAAYDETYRKYNLTHSTPPEY